MRVVSKLIFARNFNFYVINIFFMCDMMMMMMGFIKPARYEIYLFSISSIIIRDATMKFQLDFKYC